MYFLSLGLIYVTLYDVIFCAILLGTLGCVGRVGCHKRLLNPPSQFSRLGIHVFPLFVCMECYVGVGEWIFF